MGAREDYLAYRETVKSCKLCGEDVSGRPVPAYFHPTRCQLLLVGVQPEDVDHSRKQVVCFSGEQGKLLAHACFSAGLGKSEIVKNEMVYKPDMAVGFTTCLKCKCKGTAKRRVAKQCMEKFFEAEREIKTPELTVLLGIGAAKLMLPDLFAVRSKLGMKGEYVYRNQFFRQDGRDYLILNDPVDLLSRKTFDSKVTSSGDYYEFVHGLSLAASFIEKGRGR